MAVETGAAGGVGCAGAASVTPAGASCLLGPMGDRQKLHKALAAVLGHWQNKAAMCFQGLFGIFST